MHAKYFCMIPYRRRETAIGLWDPWFYIWAMNDDLPRERFLRFEVDDVSPAKPDDCRVASLEPEEWGIGALDGIQHPIDCADTMDELRIAVS